MRRKYLFIVVFLLFILESYLSAQKWIVHDTVRLTCGAIETEGVIYEGIDTNTTYVFNTEQGCDSIVTYIYTGNVSENIVLTQDTLIYAGTPISLNIKDMGEKKWKWIPKTELSD